jgi:hypothetical protein
MSIEVCALQVIEQIFSDFSVVVPSASTEKFPIPLPQTTSANCHRILHHRDLLGIIDCHSIPKYLFPLAQKRRALVGVRNPEVVLLALLAGPFPFFNHFH